MVSTRSSSVRGDSVDPDSQSPPARAVTRPATRSRRAAAAAAAFQHVPTPLTLAWMAVSLPLVIWDTGYVLGRPHTMEGGFLYWPLYVPYKLYGTVDYVYGWKAFNARDGFTAAQGSLNLLETVMYFVYLWLVLAPASASAGEPTSTTRRVEGKTAAYAVLVGFSAAVMTLSKTLLYWANEYFSGFANIGHNPAMDLLFLWIIPNGAWLVGSAYMIWSLGRDILDGLTGDSSHAKSE